MILVLVEHFLNEEGRLFFPTWVDQVESTVQNFDGFLSLDLVADVENQERTLLILRFKNLELLRIWAKSEAHDRVIGLLKEHRVKKQKSQILAFERNPFTVP